MVVLGYKLQYEEHNTLDDDKLQQQLSGAELWPKSVEFNEYQDNLRC